MRKNQLTEDAVALSSAIDAIRGEPSLVVRHGEPEAVVISFEEWRCSSTGVPSFGQLLMSAPIEPGDLPERDRSPLREVEF